jgi:hypothetical protein
MNKKYQMTGPLLCERQVTLINNIVVTTDSTKQRIADFI